ncbi:uncharacterized protein N7496_005693 [Penicillium cataractarum]|uniref:C2H2 type master regulator of conidiophore development brlA n=1 Tax=Penicillium cataractarum TaxID=2100454 RepID=A0A9W9SID7_9EURO|nr:uncharacterized protein N7496_005693 [Penicillium cataractarum]KAJ5378284.1 hypothetical protein N7496_005693 [Penicillium cataractarum]
MDWFQGGSVFESGVEFIARNPTVEPYSATRLIKSEDTSAKTPNGGWRRTSWQDFEEFTRLVCGDDERSIHIHNSMPGPFRRRQFKCTVARCSSRFRYPNGLQRHLSSHQAERSYVCWVPECQRRFTRGDNFNAHYATHGRPGGRNRYVATLDQSSSAYNPSFRGLLTSDGWPVTEGNADSSDP